MQDLVERAVALLREKKMRLACAESCTGGLLASSIIALPGASAVFDRGFVSYSNDSKIEMLGVPKSVIQEHGAVSPETAEAMAAGALEHSHAAIALSLTGIAGPEGGSTEKPVGLVFIGCAMTAHPPESFKHTFTGSREDIRRQATMKALEHLISVLEESS